MVNIPLMEATDYDTQKREAMEEIAALLGRPKIPKEEPIFEDPDLFVCHSSEDKKPFVRPFAFQMKKFGAKVWYDEFSLSLGDSLSGSIDRGLSKCRYGLVVLSPSFFIKKWTARELSGLVARELSSTKLIIPVWYKVTKEEVLRYSPPLADKFSLQVTDKNVNEAALKVLQVIRPDLYGSLLKMAAFNRIFSGRNSKPPSNVQLKDLKAGPIRHENLPRSILVRLRILSQGLKDVVNMAEAQWIDSFRRDVDPFRELESWEMMFAVYQAMLFRTSLAQGEKKLVFATLLGLTSGMEPQLAFEGLPEDLHRPLFQELIRFLSAIPKIAK